MWEESELFPGTPFQGIPLGALLILAGIVLFWTVVTIIAIRVINKIYDVRMRRYRNPKTGRFYGDEQDEGTRNRDRRRANRPWNRRNGIS